MYNRPISNTFIRNIALPVLVSNKMAIPFSPWLGIVFTSRAPTHKWRPRRDLIVYWCIPMDC